MSQREHHSSVQRVLAFLLEQADPVTRPTIADACGVSRPTAFTAIRHLEEVGLVEHVGELGGGPGRSASLYRIVPRARLVGAIDIGGSNVRVAVSDLTGTVLVEKREPTARRGGRAIVAQVAALVGEAAEQCGVPSSDLAAIGVSVPGVVSPDGRTVLYASNIDQFAPYDFCTPLARRLGTRVVLDNNVNLAALAERLEGAARDLDTFAVVAVGAGVGAGIVHAGNLLRGAHGAAGEVAFLPTYGHQRKDPKAHDEAGGLNLLRQAQERQGWQDGEPPTTVEELFRRAAEGEAVAEELVEEECQRIASVISSISAVVDPETVLLTGGVGANAQLISRTDELVKAEIPFPPNIVRSALGERASLIGAAHCVIELVKTELVESAI